MKIVVQWNFYCIGQRIDSIGSRLMDTGQVVVLMKKVGLFVPSAF